MKYTKQQNLFYRNFKRMFNSTFYQAWLTGQVAVTDDYFTEKPDFALCEIAHIDKSKKLNAYKQYKRKVVNEFF